MTTLPSTINSVASDPVDQSKTESSEEYTTLCRTLRKSLRQYPNFPSPGILFEDILPIFGTPSLHESLIRAMEMHILSAHPPSLTPPFAGVDVVVGLEARGFLFGPSLALRLGAGFVPVRKAGKLPGECVKVSYEKEYGQDWFEMQVGAIKAGQRVLIVDDIIATGGSAKAAGDLVNILGGTVVEYLFLMELDFLKGREKLAAPVFTLLNGQEEGGLGVGEREAEE